MIHTYSTRTHTRARMRTHSHGTHPHILKVHTSTHTHTHMHSHIRTLIAIARTNLNSARFWWFFMAKRALPHYTSCWAICSLTSCAVEWFSSAFGLKGWRRNSSVFIGVYERNFPRWIHREFNGCQRVKLVWKGYKGLLFFFMLEKVKSWGLYLTHKD